MNYKPWNILERDGKYALRNFLALFATFEFVVINAVSRTPFLWSFYLRTLPIS